MRKLTILIVFIPHILFCQNIDFENIVLSSNRYDSIRFICDSFEICTSIIPVGEIEGLINYEDELKKVFIALKKYQALYDTLDEGLLIEINQYAKDSVKPRLIDNIEFIVNSGAQDLFKANDSNYFFGSPMTRGDLESKLEFRSDRYIQKEINSYLVRFHKYYINNRIYNIKIFAIAPISNENGIENILFWLPIEHIDNIIERNLLNKLYNLKYTDCNVINMK